ncbi:uncharacterized protein BP5553_02086 [Venustampulla echinocandica]|uniref:Uncharacterized protein n=1 Tax=Venustampulla echinocandica TaxID=2656787 RepID=A0A370U2U6_9HELO|nr:uncharacterized protein BP5553_02086 [Venustampulla echinocandica]RDL42107.1 hypothetical protein BP5553_02086 [Venustampulla echinocandica]
MLSSTLAASFFLLPISISISALQIPSIFAPFLEPHSESLLISNETLQLDTRELLKRDGNCPANYNSCSTLSAAYGGACCTPGSVCTTDHARNIACCPVGAACTGTIARPTGTTSAEVSTTGGAIIGGSTTGPGLTATPTSGRSSSATGQSTIAPTAAPSVVPNSFFPFPYIATTYPNSVACNSAYEACQKNFAACTADLQGGAGSGFGVTIVAPEGGVTVAPATILNVGPASATSICNSLSQVACYNIQSTNCAQFGTGGSGGSFVVDATGKNGAARARQTPGCMARAGVVAGVGLGIAGQIIY